MVLLFSVCQLVDLGMIRSCPHPSVVANNICCWSTVKQPIFFTLYYYWWQLIRKRMISVWFNADESCLPKKKWSSLSTDFTFVSQMSMLLWLHKGDEHKQLLKTVTGARVTYELYNRLSAQKDVDTFQVNLLMHYLNRLFFFMDSFNRPQWQTTRNW